MPTNLTPKQIDTIELALRDLVPFAEFDHGELDCVALRRESDGPRLVEVPANADPDYRDVVFAIVGASKAIQQLRNPIHPDLEVDAAYHRLNRYFLIPETTLEIYAPLKPGHRHTEDAPRIVEAAWWNDMLTVARAAVQRYFHREFTGFLECGHPETSIGKVDVTDEMETPHCLWCGDIKDMHTLVEHLGKVYSHITNGRISKPMTLPEEVIAVADELEEERLAAALKEAGEITIVINGTPNTLTSKSLAYHDIVELAGFGQDKIIRRVTYRLPGESISRLLTPGGYANLVDGMIFDATDTYPGRR